MWPWGKKLASASLRIFCTLDELLQWSQMLCVEKELGAISFSGLEPYGAVANSADEIILRDDTYAVFLYPRSNPPKESLHMNDVQARPWGWIYIRRGTWPVESPDKDSRKVLTLSEIHGEDFEKEPVHPAKYVRWLKKQIKPITKCGVKFIGETRVSHGICYTPAACELYLSGIRWVQYPDDKGSFEPADTIV